MLLLFFSSETGGMAVLRFEGDRDFAESPDALWAKLSDARFLVPCIPDVATVHEIEPDQAKLVLRPGFAFVRGTLDVELHVVDAVAPTALTVKLHSKGIGSTSDVEAVLALTSMSSGTRVHWIAEVKALSGVLKLVPQGLIRGAAQKVVEDAWAAVAARLQSGGRQDNDEIVS
jgi:carbon monoxide dehydrogenase subunit G